MKSMTRLFHYIVVFSLVLFAIKPLLRYESAKQTLPTTQYSAVSKCSGGTTTSVSSCPAGACYTLTEESRVAHLYVLILAGLLFFIYRQLSSSSPYSRLFKPPIFTC